MKNEYVKRSAVVDALETTDQPEVYSEQAISEAIIAVNKLPFVEDLEPWRTAYYQICEAFGIGAVAMSPVDAHRLVVMPHILDMAAITREPHCYLHVFPDGKTRITKRPGDLGFDGWAATCHAIHKGRKA